MDMKEEKFSDSEETIKDTCPLIEQNHDLPASAEDPAQDLPECFEITYNGNI